MDSNANADDNLRRPAVVRPRRQIVHGWWALHVTHLPSSPSDYKNVSSDKLYCSEVLYRIIISPSGISELDCATTKTDTAERSISIGRESLQVFFCTRGLGVLPGSPQGGNREEKWRSQ